jgi:outer membrane scaffolding protein for murein synthesis (MipA/OmpV family)
MVTWSNVLLVERLRKTQEQRPQPPSGVFLGCQFTNASTGQFQQQQFYPASTAVAAGTKIFAFVADDPDTLFQVVSCSGTTVVAGVSIAVIGSNMSLIQNAGSTITGNSGCCGA